MEDDGVRTFFGFLAIIIFITLLSGLSLYTYNEWNQAESFNKHLDNHVKIEKIHLPQTSYMTAGDGSIITEFTTPQNRVFLSYDKMPDLLKKIFVTIEDRHFYEHAGVDASAISRALFENSKSDSTTQGGSTITQQLARNLYLTQEKTYNRKLTEILYSYQLERRLSKQQILELYINTIYFQNGAYGIEAASRLYFNKSVNQLSKAELVFLTAIPNNPSMYDPIRHYQATKTREDRILKQLVEQKIISNPEYIQIKSQPVILNIRKKIDTYPDYSSYVEAELKELVAQSEGYTDQLNDPDPAVQSSYQKKLDHKVKNLLESGVTIHTSLNKQLQDKAAYSVRNHLPEKDIEGSIVVIQHHTHELVSLIGGKYYKKYTFNRAFQSYRQPGSSIKPLLVYAPYIETHKPSLSEKVNAGAFCERGYCPQNYGGVNYGFVTLESAFAHSYNTPAIRLMKKTGINRSFSYLNLFHFNMVSEKDRRLPAAVGGFTYGMSPLEMTNAFTSFQNGFYQPARAIRNVTDRNGKVLYEWNEKPVKVWSLETVRKMRILLNQVVTEGTAKKAYFPSHYIGGKTGTTNDFKDLWFVGITDKYTAGVWVGKDIPASIEYKKASSPNLLIWKDTLK